MAAAECSSTTIFYITLYKPLPRSTHLRKGEASMRSSCGILSLSRLRRRSRGRRVVQLRSPPKQPPHVKPNLTGSGEGDSSRVMVVVDPGKETKAALHWTLSHSVQQHDTIVLLHATKLTSSIKGEGCDGAGENERAYGLLYTLRNMCQLRKPGLQVEVVLVEGKEKGRTVVQAAQQQKVALLVLGQRKRSFAFGIRWLWSGKSRSHERAVEYCIENAGCITIAVRRRRRKRGGYLITTQHQKNFWLLA